MTKELCSLCTDETGRAGRHEDSIYICPGLPCEVGPLCETCYNSFAAFFATEDRELLTIAYMSGVSDASTKLKADKKELISALGALVVKYKTMTPYKHLELDVAESVLEKHMTVTEKVRWIHENPGSNSPVGRPVRHGAGNLRNQPQG